MVRPGGVAAAQARDEEDADIPALGKEFQATECLMNAEVEFLLNKSREAKLLEDPDAEQNLPPVFVKTQQHVQKFGRFKNAATVDDLKDTLRKREFTVGDRADQPKRKLTSFEIAQLGNLSPASVDEAKVVVRSLEWVAQDELQNLLTDVTDFQRFQS